MARILFVTRWTSKNGDTICEAYYDSGRFYLYYDDSKIPKTVRNFMSNATNVNNAWNKTNRRRETVYK